MNTNDTTSTTTHTAPRHTTAGAAPRRLVRGDGKLGGVAAGLGDHFDVDPTIIRLGFVGLTVLGGFPAIPIGYLVAWAVMPQAEAAMPPAPTAADRVPYFVADEAPASAADRTEVDNEESADGSAADTSTADTGSDQDADKPVG